jgi:hypothetical protein
MEECGPCPVFESFTLAFVLQLRKKHGKTSLRLKILSHSTVYILSNTPTHYKTLTNTHITKPIHTHTRIHTLINHIKPPQYKLERNAYGKSKRYLVSNVVNPQVLHANFNRIFTSLHFILLHFSNHKYHSRNTPFQPLSLHFTSLHFTSLYFNSLHFLDSLQPTYFPFM